eukprot:2686278-Prorocentrum_lima.AAC.1
MERSTTARKKRTTTIHTRSGSGLMRRKGATTTHTHGGSKSMDPMAGNGNGDGNSLITLLADQPFSYIQRNPVPGVQFFLLLSSSGRLQWA